MQKFFQGGGGGGGGGQILVPDKKEGEEAYVWCYTLYTLAWGGPVLALHTHTHCINIHIHIHMHSRVSYRIFFWRGEVFICPLHSMLNSFIHMIASYLHKISCTIPMQLAVISSKPGEGKLFLGGENPSATPPLYETLHSTTHTYIIRTCTTPTHVHIHT